MHHKAEAIGREGEADSGSATNMDEKDMARMGRVQELKVRNRLNHFFASRGKTEYIGRGGSDPSASWALHQSSEQPGKAC